MELLRVENISKEYYIRRHWWNKPEIVSAVQDISFSISRGDSFGLVGESGCGKSTLAQLIALLQSPTAGKVFYEGTDVTSLGFAAKRELRRKLQIVFQDASSSLNPRFTVMDTLIEPLANYDLCDESSARLNEITEAVEIPKRLLQAFPHELSGGEKQRVSIARAMILKPQFVIFDEVTTGLDTTLQYRILQLLQRLRKEFNLTYLFITHDLRLLPQLTSTVGIMRSGRLVESLSSADIGRANHPYTRALLNSIPAQHPRLRKG